MRIRLCTVFVIGVVAACRPTPPAPAAPTARPELAAAPARAIETRVPPTQIAWPPDTFALALPEMAAAPWSLPPFEPGRTHPLDHANVIAASRGIAIAKARDILIGSSTTTGIVGALRMPERAMWHEIVAGDLILVADEQGQLWRAPTLEVAVQRGFERVARVTGAKRWDASGHFVIAVEEPSSRPSGPGLSSRPSGPGATAWISADGGATFGPMTSPGKGTIETMVVRDDGVVVAQMSHKVRNKSTYTVMLSGDAGRTWSRSAWHPFSVYRHGGWIIGDDSAADRDIVGLLASDGKAWSKHGRVWEEISANGEGWRLDFAHDPALAPDGRVRADAMDLVAPPPPARPLRGKPLVLDDKTFGLSGIGGGTGFGESGVPHCKGVSCLHSSVGEAPFPVAIDVLGFGDARCAVATTPCPFAERRSPHFAVFDHRHAQFDLVQLPTACADVEIVDAGGLTLVGCALGDHRVVYGVDPTGKVARESITADGAAPWSLGLVSMATDGTIWIPQEGACDRWAAGWVRRPLAVGAADAWRHVVAERARAWRAVGAGIAIGVIDRGDSLAALQLDHPDGHSEVVLDGIRVAIDVTGVSVKDGRVVFWDGAEGKVVQRDGSLVATGHREPDRIVDGVIVTRARPWLDCGP